MSKYSPEYWEGRRAEAARIAAKEAPNFPDLASSVAKALGRDQARKDRICRRSPGVFGSMDAGELSQSSSRELAARELKELGIDPADNDPEALLDAHHAGRQWARDRTAGRRGGASDSAEPSFLDAYLREGE